MLKKILLSLTTLTAVLGVSTAALADDHNRGWGHERWERTHRYYPYYAPRPVYVVPAPRVVYTPPPPVVYSYPAAPVYAPAPVYSAPAVSIRLHLPL